MSKEVDTLSDRELAVLRKVIKNIGTGDYLKQSLLVRAMHGVASFHVGRTNNNILEWVLASLLVLVWGAVWFKHYRQQPTDTSQPEAVLVKSTGQVDITPVAAVRPLQVATPNLIDNTPSGAYDFTLLLNGSDVVNIPSPCDGEIRRTRWQGVTGWGPEAWGAGNIVELNCNGTNYGWLMGHLKKLHVKTGSPVKRGQSLGIQGCEGRCSGPHVHAQIHRQSGWKRIEDRSTTSPILQAYLDFVTSK